MGSIRVLLVEDEPITALVTSRLLQAEGYAVEHVRSGEAAVAATASAANAYDLILMDIELGSSTDGIGAAQQVVAQCEAPLVFLSGYRDPEVLARAERISSYGYVLKGAGQAVLGTAIRTALRLHRHEAALRFRSQVTELTASLARRFADRNPNDLDQTIRESLGTVGAFWGTGRAVLALIDRERSQLNVTHEWCAPGILPAQSALQRIPCSSLTWAMAILEQGRTVNVPCVAQMPAEAANERSILLAHGVQAAVAVPLIWNGRLRGFVGFDAVREPRRWGANDEWLLETLAVIFAQALERRALSERLTRIANDRATLLRELQHRIKNNLHMIGSILEFSKSRVTEPEALQAMRDVQARVHSIARVYERLLRGPDAVDHIDLGAYLQELAQHLLSTYHIGPSAVRLVTELQSIEMDARRAVAVGLLLNELVTNALKYAFDPQRAGLLAVRLSATDIEVVLSVEDDGVGCPVGFDSLNSTGIGFSIVRLLVEHLCGELHFESIPGAGTTVVIRFPRIGGVDSLESSD